MMTSFADWQREPCALHGGGDLPPVLFAPESSAASLYWPRLPDSPVEVGQAVAVRDGLWLVDQVNEWRESPCGTHAKVLEINATGLLQRVETTAGAYGLTRTVTATVPILGVLRVTDSAETAGEVDTRAEFRPAGPWVGEPRDQVVFDGDPGGVHWEQVGDPRHASRGAESGVPVIELRKVRS